MVVYEKSALFTAMAPSDRGELRQHMVNNMKAARGGLPYKSDEWIVVGKFKLNLPKGWFSLATESESAS